MGEGTPIEWTDHSFNGWIGCTKVSPGCDHCYAERFAHRFGGGWGPGAPRRLTSESNWKLPLRWNRAAEKAGRRDRVFCASLADVFDAEVPDEWRDRLFALIAVTPHLDWLLLTKRPKVAAKYITCNGRIGMRDLLHARLVQSKAWADQDHVWPLPNVWLGTSVENQKMADLRIPTLLEIPAAKRFLSVEPLLGPVDLFPIEGCLDWVIVGGESGPKARPMHPEWARSIRDQCVEAGVPFFFKQWGKWAPHTPRAGGDLGGDVWRGAVRIVHPTGQSDGEVFEATGGRSTIPGSRYMESIGKKAAGRLLDGREWNEAPGHGPQ